MALSRTVGVYDVTGPLDPAEGFWAVLDEAGEVAGYACFGLEARVPGLAERPGVLDVGVGMRPDLTGQGRGRAFAEAVLAHGHAVTGHRPAARGRAGLERPQPAVAGRTRVRGDRHA